MSKLHSLSYRFHHHTQRYSKKKFKATLNPKKKTIGIIYISGSSSMLDHRDRSNHSEGEGPEEMWSEVQGERDVTICHILSFGYASFFFHVIDRVKLHRVELTLILHVQTTHLRIIRKTRTFILSSCRHFRSKPFHSVSSD